MRVDTTGGMKKVREGLRVSLKLLDERLESLIDAGRRGLSTVEVPAATSRTSVPKFVYLIFSSFWWS